ncbi:MAG TPA: hypothetical protein VFA51_12645 [Candidatus Udaeobacter sp.]|nr:hypothetical protein [Candidatus Udaeobacter sp.]
MKTAKILAIAIAAALPGAVLLAQGEHGKMGGMMQEHQKMAAEMKAQDAELDRLVAEMNAATGEKKIDAIAAVITKMVEQRKAMHQKMGGMHGMMEGGMMKHEAEGSATPEMH